MKTQQQENFPVACRLFNRKFRKIITDYYNFARYCDDIADNPELSSAEKLQQLDAAEQALYGRQSLPCADAVRSSLAVEHIDVSVAADLLTAFRQDAAGKNYQTWGQLLDYCRYSAAPVGRFMLALHDENPSTYLPAAALCAVLQLVNHIQDLGSDVKMLNRIYLPEELMRRHKVSKRALSAAQCSKSLHFLLNDILNRCCGLLKDAEILPAIVKSLRLRIYICITLKLTKILINKLYNGDVLAEKISLSGYDRIRAAVSGLAQALTTRRRTLSNKGL